MQCHPERSEGSAVAFRQSNRVQSLLRQARQRGDARGSGERDEWSAGTKRSEGVAPLGRAAVRRARSVATTCGAPDKPLVEL
jgi:hypothetical protein